VPDLSQADVQVATLQATTITADRVRVKTFEVADEDGDVWLTATIDEEFDKQVVLTLGDPTSSLELTLIAMTDMAELAIADEGLALVQLRADAGGQYLSVLGDGLNWHTFPDLGP